MNNQMAKNFFNVTMLVTALVVLSACDMFKDKGCSSCGSADKSELKGEALLTIDGKPVVTVESFDSFWNDYQQGNPQAALVAQFHPGIKREIFEQSMVPLHIARAYVARAGKDKSEKYQSDLRKQRDLLESALAFKVLQEDIINDIDKSPAALEAFYNENRANVGMFQQAPFVVSPAGIVLQLVEFANDKQATEFADKAKKAGANVALLAKTALKTVKDLGLVTSDSKNVDAAVKAKAATLNPGDVAKIEVSKNKVVVVKAGDKKAAVYASFDKIQEKPELLEAAKEALVQTKGQEAFAKKLDDLKAEYKVNVNSDHFKLEEEKKQAEMQEKMKAMQEAQKAAAPAKSAAQAA